MPDHPNEPADRPNMYFLGGHVHLGSKPSRWGSAYRVERTGEPARIHREKMHWWGSESYATRAEAEAAFDGYRLYGFHGGVVEARSESHRRELDRARTDFLHHEPDILQRKIADDARWDRRFDRMFLTPWYTRPFWSLVYGNPRAWRVFGILIAVPAIVLTLLLAIP
ncbi:hypothetical protein [Nocardia carnea]|uniref:hypothetical protein n=1 Tax=Nocardia carnea TaxID=37328 RepID=UPI002453D239|nr:hypothetical protein [Nocardia carnea]